jgi:PAS domain S-box-containing protein
MRGRLRYRRLEAPAVRYIAAIALAVAAQIVRIPLHEPTVIPFITYAPFAVASALIGGFGPGLLTTILCALETVYFSVEPVGSFTIADPTNYVGVVAFAVTGLVASVFAERLKQIGERLAAAHRKTTAILEGISDGFDALDNEWCYTYVNAAAAKLLGKTREELIGKNLWEIWPHAADSPFGEAYRRAVAENVPVEVEAFYPEPLNAWIEVRCYPSPEGLSHFFSNTTERKRSQERLQLLESAILQTSDGILIVKASGEDFCHPDPVFANAAFERMTGFSLQDLQAGALPLLHGPSLDPHAMEQALADSHAKSPAPSEQPIHRKDGSQFWAESNFLPLKDESGKYTHCVWTLRDVTERTHAEVTSRLLSSIVEYSNDAIISKTLDGIVLSWNKGAERVYGYTSAEIVGQPMSLLVPPNHPNEFPALMERVRLGETIEHYETERIKKDEQHIVVSLTVSPILDAANKIAGASVVARDITVQKRAERAVQLSEERYRALALVTSQIVWTTNPEGEVVEDISTLRAFTGLSAQEMRGSGWMEAVHPEDRERTAHSWARSVRDQSFYDSEYRMRRRDGEYRWMAVRGVPVLEEKGLVREWVGTCADITERKQAEEEIRRLNQDLERRVAERTAQYEATNQELEAFAYSVSHDLRAPLRAIDGFSRILLEEHGPNLAKEARHYLDVVQTNAVQMGELIDHLLAFSRLSRQPLRRVTVDLGVIVRQALDQLAVDPEGREVELVIGQLPGCEADPALLKQVFVNLLSNALKYTKPRNPARIEVGVLARDEAEPAQADTAVYYVRDNGVGFNMRYVEKLFGVFQRLHRAEEFEGTGVGLAIVQRIISRHGGRIWADAVVDRGATFYFTLAGAEVAPAQGPTPWPVSA